ncbi:hypothetical protein [Nocardia nova]|jgi:hypothetical protein|uniref:hypothetical protein n=1 Tax=Nocardia nova TaxID=37330 RepID=UPI0018934AAB|nr:hypothetical protein [Nocardia nova]MBF6147243.1 hypothetical protein [Nocardia nova]
MNAAAHWLTGRGTRRIWIAVLIVAVVAGVAAVVWVNRSPEEPSAGPAAGGRFRISGRLDSAPVPRWTLRAADLSHEPGAVLLALPHSLDNYYGYGSPMDAGPMIVAATAVPGEPGPGTAPKAGPVRLHGIDPGTGAVRWTIDAGELLSCNERVFDGRLTCRGTHRVLIVDAATGTIATDRSTDFEVTDVAVRDGVVSVAGRTADRMTAVVAAVARGRSHFSIATVTRSPQSAIRVSCSSGIRPRPRRRRRSSPARVPTTERQGECCGPIHRSASTSPRVARARSKE